ncbi:DUF3889 domain-containing protein [Ornithinibacillus halotolerans]|uniref:DUF3889 domain-containing protein n=1 Tax=Ornithinibacillus halotolerans TaxID=1274357 RepID=A0A916WAS6_9BACI|nr:DUF3889 domain-containing protein [Ornithinibacillus halotolerans]GGA80946.1 hypothetical protein GCM10008025_25350 [Ornithinibacillus halotolerans]
MYYYNPYMYQYRQMPHYPVYPYYPTVDKVYAKEQFRQVIVGEATWTSGGQITKCGLPWSTNEYMTVAVGEDSLFQCGDALKVRNPLNGREVIVTVVDQAPGYPQNRINLHRRAFQTLGVNLNQGVMKVEIISSPELEAEKWGKYLLELVQTAYPEFEVTDYKSVKKEELSESRVKETFDFILHLQNEEITVRGNVVYNPQTDRVISFDLAEI